MKSTPTETMRYKWLRRQPLGTIYCEDRGIAKLTGIEAFVKITGLECGGNDLIFLNVGKNTELRRLYCGRNEIFHWI